jgi:quinol monooxygenase YgiN
LGVFIREAFLRAVQENSLQEIVRQEDGCLEYAYYAAVADAEKILLVEKWASEEQQQTHLRQLKRWKEQYIAETAVEKI